MRYRKPGTALRRWLIVLAAFTGLVVAVWGLTNGYRRYRRNIRVQQDQEGIVDLWEKQDYETILSLGESTLSESPLDVGALAYAGYSSYYLAVSRKSQEERNSFLDRAIRHLRLRNVTVSDDLTPMIDYVLGKAYYLKGPSYADLADYYLRRSLDAGYRNDDTYEFLGQAASALGDYKTSLDWFTLAARDRPTDRLLLRMGEDSISLGRYDDAAAYFMRSLDVTRDDALRKKGLFQLGKLYYDMKNFTRARDTLAELAELAPDDAEAHFLLGEVYFELGDMASARREWFRTTYIRPDHRGALLRLYD